MGIIPLYECVVEFEVGDLATPQVTLVQASAQEKMRGEVCLDFWHVPESISNQDPVPVHHHSAKLAYCEQPLVRLPHDKCVADPNFFEDAITLSRMLELTLTGKEGGKAVSRVQGQVFLNTLLSATAVN